MPYLLCIDFDDTLINGHSHNTLQSLRVVPGMAQISQIEHLSLKFPEFMCEAIRSALSTGNHIAILSFTSYQEIIRPTLLRMGLSPDEIENIFVKGGFPSDNNPLSPLGKNEHIKHAMNYFGIESNSDIILFDDSQRNISAAARIGHVTVKVPTAREEIIFSEYNDVEMPAYIRSLRMQMDQLSKPKTKRLLAQTIRTYSESLTCYLSDGSDVPSSSAAIQQSPLRGYFSSWNEDPFLGDDPGTPYETSSPLTSCSSQERSDPELTLTLSHERSSLKLST